MANISGKVERINYGPALIYPGLPVHDGWTQPLLHRCSNCALEAHTSTRPGQVMSCVACRDAHGLESSMHPVVPLQVWRALSLN